MKVLVYDDSRDFGGHQIMACHGIRALADSLLMEVTCMIDPGNKRLAGELSGLPLLSPPCTVKKLRTLAPDLVLCIQGDIRQSIRGTTAARQAGIPCVSYIANPHRMADMGAKLGSLRDRLYQPLFNRPDRFITISDGMKDLLISRGCTQPISVVQNGVMPPPPRPGRSSQRTVLGLLGRVEFSQKQQHFMLRTFLEYPDAFMNCELLIAGEGPDRMRLMKMAENADNVTILPWQDDVNALYDRIDFLMLPSRYEGVPLVMLEALARGIPVIGSAVDGMKELLPENWLFGPGDSRALTDTFSRIRDSWKHQMNSLQQKVLNEYTINAFRSAFVQAVTGQ